MKDAMIPRRRLVKVNKTSNRQLGTREGNGQKPFYKWNAILQRYEYVVSFFDPDTSEEYQVIMDKKGWQTVIRGLEKAYADAFASLKLLGHDEKVL